MTELALGGALADAEIDPIDGAPEAEMTVAPRTIDETARILEAATQHRLSVLIWGGGTHQGMGGRVEPDVVLSTSRLNSLVDWQPDDLTVVAESGMKVADLEDVLSERSQTAVLPEHPLSATVGGVVASGVSAWRRLRYGPTRDRMLEVVIVTGDGRVVRGGGRVVKNVTGYDLPRLATGSFGSLGLVVQVCLKLWPVSPSAATVTTTAQAAKSAYRPLATISDRDTTKVYIGGHEKDVEAQLGELGGEAERGLVWPEPFSDELRVEMRVPARFVDDAIGLVPGHWSLLAERGVGRLQLGGSLEAVGEITGMRSWAEQLGGSLVIDRAPAQVYREIDPWVTPPATQDLQRRVVAQFDPARVVNPGRLPGGL